MLLEWTPDLSVGDDKFDGEHRELVGIINELDAAMTQGHGSQVLGRLLARLVEYTKNHFASEETVMQARGYPAATEHKGEHARLVDQVLDLQDAFEGGRRALSVQTMDFLRDWLRKHILDVDKRLGAWLSSNP